MRFRGPQALSDTFGTQARATISIYAASEGVSLIREISGLSGFRGLPPKTIPFRAAQIEESDPEGSKT